MSSDSPITVLDALQILRDYHRLRASRYREVAQRTADAAAKTVLNHVVGLDDEALEIVLAEIERLDPDHATYMLSGPTIDLDMSRAAACHCGESPSWDDVLGCVFESDACLDQVLHRLEGCSAAPSVQELAARIRELEESKTRRLAKFARQD